MIRPETSGSCLKMPIRDNCIICMYRCSDRCAPFEVEAWKKATYDRERVGKT